MWTLKTELNSRRCSERRPFGTDSWLLVHYFAVSDLKALGVNGQMA